MVQVCNSAKKLCRQIMARFGFCPKQLKFVVKILLGYTLLSVCLLPSLRSNWKFSKVYQQNTEMDFDNAIEINYQRRLEANKYLANLDAAKVKQTYVNNEKSTNLRFVIGVITVARNTQNLKDHQQTQYLTQVLSRLHEVLDKSHALNKVYIFMCNVDPYPDKHQEANRMADFFPNVRRGKTGSFYRGKNRHVLEKQDYAFCLQSAMKYNSKYVLLIQDDAYPHENFYQVMNNILRTKLETRIEMGELVPDNGDWAWLKLNTPYYRNDFHSDIYNIYQWVALTMFFAGSVALIFHIYQECQHLAKNRGRGTSQNKMAAYLVFLVSFPCIFAIIWTIGRPYFLKARSLSSHFYYLEPGTSCCLPAVVYPRNKISDIIEFISRDSSHDEAKVKEHKKVQPLDWALHDYREQKELRQYLLTPNIFTHIGFYSTLNLKFYKQKSFAYEYFHD